MEALAGNVGQARLMKNTPPLRGAFRLPFADAHGPSVPAPSGQPPLQGGPFLPFFKRELVLKMIFLNCFNIIVKFGIQGYEIQEKC